jgi:hypothetical protein
VLLSLSLIWQLRLWQLLFKFERHAGARAACNMGFCYANWKRNILRTLASERNPMAGDRHREPV